MAKQKTKTQKIETFSPSLSAAKASIENNDPHAFSQALADLILQEPSRWRMLLMLNHIIPDAIPTRSDIKERLLFLTEGVKLYLAQGNSNSKAGMEFQGVLRTILVIYERQIKVVEALNRLPFFRDNKSTQIVRLAAFMEAQSYLLQSQAIEEMKKNENVVPSVMGITPTVPDLLSGNKHSLVDAYEWIADATELNLRYVMHTFPGNIFGEPEDKTIWKDEHFVQVVTLGSLWNQLKTLWEDIKYRGWISVEKDSLTEGSIIFLMPPDEEEWLRVSAAKMRTQLFLQEAATPFLPFGTDTRERIKAMSDSVKVPEFGQVWNGEIDIEKLTEACQRTTLSMIAEDLISRRHYSELLGKIDFGLPNKAVTWIIWRRVIDVLRVIAKVIETANMRELSDPAGADVMRNTVIIDTLVVARLIHHVSKLPVGICRDTLELLTFDAARKKLYIWDQPLLPLGDSRCLLVPNLISGGSALVAIENLMAQWAGNKFSVRSVAFERHVASILDKAPDCHVCHNMSFIDSDGKQAQFDIIAFWKGFVILAEAKCLRTPHSPGDEWGAREDINKGIEQLQRRRILVD